MLIVTADHGCDPALSRHRPHPGICSAAGLRPRACPGRLGVRATSPTSARPILDVFGFGADGSGRSFLPEILSARREEASWTFNGSGMKNLSGFVEAVVCQRQMLVTSAVGWSWARDWANSPIASPAAVSPLRRYPPLQERRASPGHAGRLVLGRSGIRPRRRPAGTHPLLRRAMTSATWSFRCASWPSWASRACC